MKHLLFVALFSCVYISSTFAATGSMVPKPSVATSNTGAVASGSIGAPVVDQEFISALEWMHSYGLTKYKTSKEYKPNETVSREQAAKFYTQFAVNVLYKVIDMTKYCEFNDLKDADPSLRNSILTSCLLHLFQGKHNKFSPLATLTKAESLVVLVRAIDTPQDETVTPRYKAYHKRAVELGLTKENNINLLEKPVTRYEIALMLYRASKKAKK